MTSHSHYGHDRLSIEAIIAANALEVDNAILAPENWGENDATEVRDFFSSRSTTLRE